MTRSCKWGNCNNSDHKSPTLRFIPFAKPFGKHADVKRAQKWVDLCARKDFSVKSINNDSYICAHHFPNYETKEELTPQTNKELEPYSFLAWLQSPNDFPEFVPTQGNTNIPKKIKPKNPDNKKLSKKEKDEKIMMEIKKEIYGDEYYDEISKENNGNYSGLLESNSHFINEDDPGGDVNMEDFLEKPKDHNCDSCGKSFSNAPNLKRHIYTIHEGRKDFKCDFCEWAFAQSGDLRKHIRTVHQGRRDHKCKFCGSAFSEKGSLNKHMRSFHEDEILEQEDEDEILKKPKKKYIKYNSYTHAVNNPWQVSDYNEFLYYCCPECTYRSKDIEDFQIHAINVHLVEIHETENFIKKEPQQHQSHNSNDFKVEERQSDLTLSSYICTKLSSNTQNQNQHYKCQYCKAFFKTKTELEVHHDDIHLGQELIVPGPIEIESNTPSEDWQQDEMKVKNEIIGDDDNDDEIPEESDGNYSEENQFLDDGDEDEDANIACNVEDFLEKPKEISCDFCGKIFSQKCNLRRHIYTIHEGHKDFKCGTCERPFAQAGDLRKHIRTVHQGIKNYKCQFCGSAFSEAGSLKKHINSFHGDNNSQNVITTSGMMEDLDDNEIITPTPQNNGSIVKTEHLPSDSSSLVQSNNSDLKCDHCGEKFGQRQLLIDHISEIHLTKDIVETTEHEEYQCPKCPKAFITKKWLLMHLKKKNCIPPCNICGKIVSSKHALKVHMASAHNAEKPFKCNLCHRSFVTNPILQQHLKNSHGERKYKCEHCPQMFVFPGEKNKHERAVHQNIRDHICNYCGNSFKDSSTLNKHITVMHIDGKPFKCDKCDKKFIRQLMLDDHINFVHEGKKNYACDVCGSTFGTQGILDGHKKQVHYDSLDFACPICGKRFVTNWKRERHIRGVHEGQKVSCPRLSAPTPGWRSK